MITQLARGTDEGDRPRADHVAAEDVERPVARRVDLRGDVGPDPAQRVRPQLAAVGEEVEGEQDAQDHDDADLGRDLGPGDHACARHRHRPTRPG